MFTSRCCFANSSNLESGITAEPCRLLLCCHRFRKEEEVGGPRFSPRGGFRGGSVEQDLSRDAPHWEREPDHRLRPRSPRPGSFGRERPRTPEDVRGRHLQDDWRHDARRSPTPPEPPNPARYGSWDGMSQRGRGAPRGGRGGQGGRGRGQPRGQAWTPQPSHGYHHGPPHEEQPSGPRAFRDGCYEEKNPGWSEEATPPQWDRRRPGSLDRHVPEAEPELKMQHQRQRGWKNPTTNTTDETLKIKVDMSRPVKPSR